MQQMEIFQKFMALISFIFSLVNENQSAYIFTLHFIRRKKTWQDISKLTRFIFEVTKRFPLIFRVGRKRLQVCCCLDRKLIPPCFSISVSSLEFAVKLVAFETTP